MNNKNNERMLNSYKNKRMEVVYYSRYVLSKSFITRKQMEDFIELIDELLDVSDEMYKLTKTKNKEEPIKKRTYSNLIEIQTDIFDELEEKVKFKNEKENNSENGSQLDVIEWERKGIEQEEEEEEVDEEIEQEEEKEEIKTEKQNDEFEFDEYETIDDDEEDLGESSLEVKEMEVVEYEDREE